jgi:outer membrane protein assembly factor BamB
MSTDPGDPDALWKPGYTGGFRAPEAADHTPANRARPGRLGRVVVVASLVALASVAIVAAPSFRDGPGPVPPTPWTITFDTVTVGAVDSRSGRLAALVERPGVVVLLDLVDGAELWRRSAPGDSATGLDIVAVDPAAGDGRDAVVVVRHVDADGTGSALALDVETGRTRWRWSLAVGERVDVVSGELRRSSVRVTTNGPDGVASVDPLSGELLGPVDPDDVDRSPSDNVFRQFGTASGVARTSVEVDTGLVEISIDAAVAATTFAFTPFDTADEEG